MDLLECFTVGNLKTIDLSLVKFEELEGKTIFLDKFKNWEWRFLHNMNFLISFLYEEKFFLKEENMKRYVSFLKTMIRNNLYSDIEILNKKIITTNIIFHLNSFNFKRTIKNYLVFQFPEEFRFYMDTFPDRNFRIPYTVIKPNCENIESYTDSIFSINENILISEYTETPLFIENLLERLNYLITNKRNYYENNIKPHITNLTERYWVNLNVKAFSKYYPRFLNLLRESCYLIKEINLQTALRFDCLSWALFFLPKDISSYFLSLKTTEDSTISLLKIILIFNEKGIKNYCDFIHEWNEKHLESSTFLSICSNVLTDGKCGDLSLVNKIHEFPISSITKIKNSSGHVFYFSPYDLDSFNQNEDYENTKNPYSNEIISRDEFVSIIRMKNNIDIMTRMLDEAYDIKCNLKGTVIQNLLNLRKNLV